MVGLLLLLLFVAALLRPKAPAIDQDDDDDDTPAVVVVKRKRRKKKKAPVVVVEDDDDGDDGDGDDDVPAGSWVTIGVYQNFLGALNFAQSWTQIVNEWWSFLPDTWGSQSPVINADGFGVADAVVQVHIPAALTIGAIGTLANKNRQVSVRSVTVNGGAPADPDTLQQQADDNKKPALDLTGALTDIEKLLGSLTGLAIVVIIAVVLYQTKPWQYLPTPKGRRR